MKGGNYMEALARARTVVFDKTGTLTKGVFEIQAIHPVGLTRDRLLEAAAYAESLSNHPIALSIRRAYAERSIMDMYRMWRSCRATASAPRWTAGK